MNIVKGYRYTNRTYKYLLPCVKSYGPTFVTKFNNVFKLAVGIGDAYFDNQELRERKSFYILLDKRYKPAMFEQFMNWIVNQRYYISDYCFDDIIKGYKHMVVIDVPLGYHLAYDRFIAGEYSIMYNKKELEAFFPTKEMANQKESHKLFYHAKQVLQKSPEMIDPFILRIKEKFGHDVDITREDLIGKELDFPIDKKEEIFNYGEV